MRKSSYVIVAPAKDGQNVIIQGYTGAVDLVSDDVLALLRSLVIEEDTRREYGVSHGAYTRLISRGYITDKTPTEELDRVKAIARALHATTRRHQAQFIIAVTYRCNLRCFYCSQGHSVSCGLNSLDKAISRELVDCAFESMAELKPAKDAKHKYRLGLYGGEPLLRCNREIVAYICEQAIRNGYSIGGVTNGVELDAYSELLGPGKIDGLQITLDGGRQCHDVRRIGPGYPATFDVISNNITEALAKGVQISLRINVDGSNVDSVVDLSRHIVKQGWDQNKRFSAYAHTVRFPQADGSHKGLTLYQVAKLLAPRRKEMPYHISCYDSYAASLFRLLLHKGTLPIVRSWWCSANANHYVFDPFGDVYACWEEVSDPAKRIGTYGPAGLAFNEKKDMWFGRNIAEMQRCSRCPFALLCGGGCAVHANEAHGSYYAPYCNQIQRMLVETIPKVYQQYLEQIPGVQSPPA